MKGVSVLLLFCAIGVMAAQPEAYKIGTLVSFKWVTTGGTSCKDNDGGITFARHHTSHCQPDRIAEYTVEIDGKRHVLSPVDPRKPGVLADRLPGLRFWVREDKDGIHVKLDKRESKYHLAGD
jgi:hypothetical protein